MLTLSLNLLLSHEEIAHPPKWYPVYKHTDTEKLNIYRIATFK